LIEQLDIAKLSKQITDVAWDSSTEEDLGKRMDIAVEYRQRIADWSHHLVPGEFRKKKIGHALKE